MRWLIGIGTGILVALLGVLLIEGVGELIYPLPEPEGTIDPREQAQLIPDQPFPAKLIILLAWFGGTLIGAALAVRSAGRGFVAWIVALAVMLRNFFAMSAIAYPTWMWFAALILPPLAAWIASRYTPRRRAPDADPETELESEPLSWS